MGVNKVADLEALAEILAKSNGVVRILVDHPDQVRFLETFVDKSGSPRRWSTFMKVDAGSK